MRLSGFCSLLIRWCISGALLILSTAIWLPLLHLFFKPTDGLPPKQGRELSPLAESIAHRQLALWENSENRAESTERMRRSNAEWDFMARTYLVLALANMSLRNPDQASRYITIMDSIIGDTVAIERERGHLHFLMDYAAASRFVDHSQRSLFVDGEIALMQGARRLVRDDAWSGDFAERVAHLKKQMSTSPVLCGESYPNEGWMFCNSIALVTLRMSDVLDGTDHGLFFHQWLSAVKQSLVHQESGMLVSSFTWNGHPLDGPEGSSIFMSAHCLEVIDEEFARMQYDLAKRELFFSVFGFGLAREWPKSWLGPMDIDSGPIVPIVEASAGSSGMAILGAAAFSDKDTMRRLVTSLNFAAFPIEDENGTRFAASNQVGDAVILYSLVQGPLWRRLREDQ